MEEGPEVGELKEEKVEVGALGMEGPKVEELGWWESGGLERLERLVMREDWATG